MLLLVMLYVTLFLLAFAPVVNYVRRTTTITVAVPAAVSVVVCTDLSNLDSMLDDSYDYDIDTYEYDDYYDDSCDQDDDLYDFEPLSYNKDSYGYADWKAELNDYLNHKGSNITTRTPRWDKYDTVKQQYVYSVLDMLVQDSDSIIDMPTTVHIDNCYEHQDVHSRANSSRIHKQGKLHRSSCRSPWKQYCIEDIAE